jgi:hypothetical protein
MAWVAKASSEYLKCHSDAGRKNDKGTKQRCLSLGPSPGLLHGPPDVGSSLGRAGIAGEVVVFKGPFNPVLVHAIGIRGDTECNVSRGGPVLVLDRSLEAL